MRTYLSAYHIQLYGREEQCKQRFQPGRSTTKAPMSSTHTLGKSRSTVRQDNGWLLADGAWALPTQNEAQKTVLPRLEKARHGSEGHRLFRLCGKQALSGGTSGMLLNFSVSVITGVNTSLQSIVFVKIKWILLIEAYCYYGASRSLDSKQTFLVHCLPKIPPLKNCSLIREFKIYKHILIKR